MSFEASCVIAGVPPIGLVIDGKVQFYKKKHGLENSDIICNMLLPVYKWPHPAWQVTIMETNEASTYPIEINTDGSKASGTVGVGVAIYQNKQLTVQRRNKLRGLDSNSGSCNGTTRPKEQFVDPYSQTWCRG